MGTEMMLGCPEAEHHSMHTGECGAMERKYPLYLICGLPDSSAGKESACNLGDHTLIPRLGRSAGEGIIYPLQYSWASQVAQMVKNPLEYGKPGFDPWVGKIPW